MGRWEEVSALTEYRTCLIHCVCVAGRGRGGQ